MIKELRTTGTALALVALAGCSTVNQFLGKEESIDYKSAQAARPSLTVPPDLTQVPGNSRYSVPGGSGTATYSDYATEQARRQAQAGDASNAAVLPQREDMRLARDGELRWLVVNMPATEVFNKAVEFWQSEGFAIRSQNPQAGLIETDWAENRANIPQDFLRRTIGRVFDQVWDSGERQLFRTRLERGPDGQIEVYFSHQHMVEKVVSEAQTKWEPGASDPALDAAMLSRFMVFLGAEEERARSQLAAIQPEDTAPSAAQIVTGGGANGSLEIAEPFDRAWRRVGLALDRGNFTVEDRDRAAGQYYVRYVDVDAQQQQQSKGIFSRLFGSKEPQVQPQYRVLLTELGSATRVTVLDSEGQPDNGATAQRILDVLLQQLRD
jgi:outer membrane protein assembly factor BamC